MAFAADDNGLVAALKDVTYALVAAVHVLCEYAVKLAHAQGQVALDGFDYQVVVVAHLAPGMHDPAKALATLSRDIYPKRTICVAVMDIFTAITARGDVEKTARDSNA